MSDTEINEFIAVNLMGKENHPKWGMTLTVDDNYTTDAESCYLMEAKIAELGLTEPYILALSDLIDSGVSVYYTTIELDAWSLFSDNPATKYLFAMIHASPAQRAQAAVKMLQEQQKMLKCRTGNK